MRRGSVVGLFVAVVVAAVPSVSAGSGTTIVAAWTQLGPSNLQVARVVVSGGGDCPTLSLSSAGGPSDAAMEVRAGPEGSFDDTVCEAAIPAGTTEASVEGHTLPVRKTKLRRIALVGDTGCANTTSKMQNCDDPNEWPFGEVAGSVASEHPDLIIHLGDILYRKENGCKEGCSAGIDDDLFAPAAPMLAAAPLVMVRGNHEAEGADCAGWFRYFAVGPAISSCKQFTKPYEIKLTTHRELVVLDTSAAANNDQTDVPKYTKELRQANKLARQPAWLISHVPLWDVAKGKGVEGGPGILQRALQDLGEPLSPNFRMVISGHLHQFEWLSFTTQVPAQLILGDGGTKLSKAESGSFAGMEVDEFNKITVLEGKAKSIFGYGLIQLKNKHSFSADPKSITLNKVDGSEYRTCSLHRYDLHC